MIVTSLFFYLFSAITIFAAIMVVSSRNPVTSVLFLILTFFSAAGLFVLLGAEFIAMLIIIVYVGAVAVLFLFVVMMLDINYAEMRKDILAYLPLGIVIGIVILSELAIVFGGFIIPKQSYSHVKAPGFTFDPLKTNTEQIGDVLYTQYVFMFELAGIILLVAMIGAIVLTLHQRKNVKRQDIPTQVWRKREDSVELKDVEPGEGV